MNFSHQYFSKGAVIITTIIVALIISTQSYHQLVRSYTRMSSVGGVPGARTFAQYSIYKGKGAIAIKPIPPTYTTAASGSQVLSREGALFFEVAPIGSKPREYDWSKKETFSLCATECGDILHGLHSRGSNSDHIEFFHDPSMGGKPHAIIFLYYFKAINKIKTEIDCL